MATACRGTLRAHGLQRAAREPAVPAAGATMNETLGLLQWPAMIATVAAAWLVASTRQRARRVGFWIFLCSNVLWAAWGLHAGATAVVVLQLCLAALNIRGANKAGPSAAAPRDAPTGQGGDP